MIAAYQRISRADGDLGKDDGAQFQTGCADILVQRRTGTCGANSVYLRSLSGQ